MPRRGWRVLAVCGSCCVGVFRSSSVFAPKRDCICFSVSPVAAPPGDSRTVVHCTGRTCVLGGGGLLSSQSRVRVCRAGQSRTEGS